jgi:hypothetical protein
MGTFPRYRNSFGTYQTVWMACMKPELHRVVLRLVIAGFAFAMVLAIVRVQLADPEAPGLKFVSPGIARK